MFCNNCGFELSNDAELCTKCGTQISSSRNTLEEKSPSAVKTSFDYKPAYNSESNLREMYGAFIGPKKSSYYIPIFERFDNGGGNTSWNWPGALITQWWMLYRGMFLWGFILYPLLGFIASAILMIPLTMAVGETPSFWITFLLSFVIMGAFSNKLFHKHTKKMITKSGTLGLNEKERIEWLIRKGSSNIGFIIILIFVGIAVIGILAAIALPAYQDYTVRAKLSDALIDGKNATNDVGEYISKTGSIPESIEITGYSPSSKYTEQIILNSEDGSISMTTNISPIKGKKIIFSPSINENKTIIWRCYSDEVEKHFLPKSCNP